MTHAKKMQEAALMGGLLKKIEFWTDFYQFQFQFWGEDDNNVFIYRDHVEIASFGGRNTAKDILLDTVKWCEKARPSVTYNQQP